MDMKILLSSIDPKLSKTLIMKPFWEVAKSTMLGMEVKTIERGGDPISFLLALETRGNHATVETIKIFPVQITPCCSTFTLTGKNSAGIEVTRVNFNLRKRQKGVPA